MPVMTSNHPINLFVAEWNSIRPDLLLAEQKERATRVNVLKVGPSEWFQVLYRVGLDHRPRLDLGMTFDSMDEATNIQALANAEEMLRSSGIPLKERGKHVKYLHTRSVNLTEKESHPYRRAAELMDHLIRVWQRPAAT